MAEDPALSPAVRAYRSALGARSWDLAALEQQTGLPRTELLAAQDHLAELGLLARTSLGGFDFMPLTPDTALRSMLDSTVHDLAQTTRLLKQVQQFIQTIGDDYQPLHTAMRFPAEVELITGRLAMSTVMEDAIRRAQHTIAFMCPGPQPTALELRHETAIYRAMLGRGVQVRFVHRTALAALTPVQHHLRALRDAGARVRIAPRLPARLMVVDSDFAVLPAFHETEEPAVLTLQSTPLITFVSSIFEHYWDAGIDLPGECLPAPDGMSQQHEEVLRMLATGLHDDAIARRMGTSTRTVRRLVAEAMEQLDAHSRFQAGVRAAVQGRVGPEPADDPSEG